MKRIFPALFAGALLCVSPVFGNELIVNEDFETSILQEEFMAAFPEHQEIGDRDVHIEPDADGKLPAHLMLNTGDGWKNASARFDYLTEAHRGARAVRVQSPEYWSALAFGDKPVPVAAQDSGQSGVVRVGVPVKVAFYAKGNGSVRLACYLRDGSSKKTALYDYQDLLNIEPGKIVIDQDNKWTAHEGVITIQGDEVGWAKFALQIKGDVSIDDFSVSIP